MPIKEKIGIVISNKMLKTITVAVKTKIPHKKYQKILARTKKYKVHDENNLCQIGDIVKIQETRPLSKTKCWTLLTKIGKLHNT
uniref:Small ribosomal subunit protein uS17c n=1 Tax=Helminthora furcellata TaxID=1884666 RepID=A0A1G4NRM5_9FLOR|nr:Ribosomal protein S17 [Helminthora furcellata]SCW21189.1 Ribosomal protein S17 [Helminthora furcellata]SCW24049.1 Ribosomal protein S17 [Helminthora furcellata]